MQQLLLLFCWKGCYVASFRAILLPPCVAGMVSAATKLMSYSKVFKTCLRRGNATASSGRGTGFNCMSLEGLLLHIDWGNCCEVNGTKVL
jgi:hypothetical protein